MWQNNNNLSFDVWNEHKTSTSKMAEWKGLKPGILLATDHCSIIVPNRHFEFANCTVLAFMRLFYLFTYFFGFPFFSFFVSLSLYKDLVLTVFVLCLVYSLVVIYRRPALFFVQF